MKKLGSGTHSTVSNYRKETENATQMGKKAHLRPSEERPFRE